MEGKEKTIASLVFPAFTYCQQQELPTTNTHTLPRICTAPYNVYVYTLPSKVEPLRMDTWTSALN